MMDQLTEYDLICILIVNIVVKLYNIPCEVLKHIFKKTSIMETIHLSANWT